MAYRSFLVCLLLASLAMASHAEASWSIHEVPGGGCARDSVCAALITPGGLREELLQRSIAV